MNFKRNIKPLFIQYIDKRRSEDPKFDIDDAIKSFSLLLGIALKNEMIFGKDIIVLNTDTALKKYINKVNGGLLERLLIRDILGTPADAFIIAKQCINELVKKHNNFDEEFKAIENFESKNKSKDQKIAFDKFNHLYALCAKHSIAMARKWC